MEKKDVDVITEKAHAVLHSKNTRNIIFLIISVVCVLAINSLLPVIEGSAHYTEASVEMSYKDYVSKHAENDNYSLTWTSQVAIATYKAKYIEEHPELSVEDQSTIKPPDAFVVSVYTEFFFNYTYWWVSTGIHMLSVLLIYYSVFNYVLNKRKQTQKRYLDLLNEVQSAADKQLDPTTFEPWMLYIFNRRRKEQQHLANVRYELSTLYKRTSYKVRHAPLDSRKRIRYETKKKSLEEQLSTTYLKEYVPSKKVRGFGYIYPTFVISGNNVIGNTVDNYSLIRSDSSKISHDGFRKVISSITMTAVFSILLTFVVSASVDKPWYYVLLNIFIKLTPMMIQIPFAYDYCDSFMDCQLIPNLLSRRSISLLYLADMQKPEVLAEMKRLAWEEEHYGEVMKGEADENKLGDRPKDSDVPSIRDVK